jgi:glutamate-1-semialdehyde 2,1-aminomutase
MTTRAEIDPETDAQELATRARHVLPGGSTHVARTYNPPLYVARARGSRKWLVDGRELIDYTMGHGALLLGHAHPSMVNAVQQQVALGTHYGAAHPREVEWAEIICSLVPSAEEVRFTASGTEAAMLAIRLARAATGREHIVKLAHHFHGWSDPVSVDLGSFGGAASVGVPAATVALTRVASAGDVPALRAALEDRQAAALLLEPSGAHYGNEPLEAGFVQQARALCDETGTLLIFDEVVTGFRVAPGGMQALLGVTPDMSMLGKVMAGGLPAGAVAGRRELMEQLRGSIQHPGTFNANPLSAAAGVATLRLVADGAPQRSADMYARTLENEWGKALQEAGVPGRIWRLSSILHLELEDQTAQANFADAMRAEGVDLLHTSAFCSSVHSVADLEESVSAFSRAIRRAAQR